VNEQDLHARLQAAGIPGVGDLDASAGDPFVVVKAEALRGALTFLRDEPDCAMEMLHLVTAVEREDRMEIAYHISSLQQHLSLVLKVIVDRPEDDEGWTPEVPSVADIHPAADWHEREQWDLLGVRFSGHPDPRRILLPEEWVGHPLRKNYVYPTEHEGMPLEVDAVPLYERDGDDSIAAGTGSGAEAASPAPPLHSGRPDAGGRLPSKGDG
jgi:NADH-quinone oxidoreductase subunit C